MTQKAYRHGDLALVAVDSIPKGLKASESKVLMTGSGGNDHVFGEGMFYPAPSGDFILGYLDAPKGTTLSHPDHGAIVKSKTLREANLPAGCYELHRQQEYTHQGMRPVID